MLCCSLPTSNRCASVNIKYPFGLDRVLHGSAVVVSDFLSTTFETNLAWPDRFLGAGCYRLQAITPCA